MGAVQCVGNVSFHALLGTGQTLNFTAAGPFFAEKSPAIVITLAGLFHALLIDLEHFLIAVFIQIYL